MTKDDKVNIKLEVYKDKTSGKLSIMAHFDSKAKNISINNNNYSWWPTIEEKNLIDEAYNLFPDNFTTNYKSTEKTTDATEIKTIEDNTIEEKITDQQSYVTDELKTDLNTEKKIEELPPIEKAEEPTVFEVTENEFKKDDITKETEEENLDPNVQVKEPIDEETDKKQKEEDVLIEADEKAIEAALKKHNKNDDDESIVEADEQTIIDKVLSQKKKGKWSKIK